MNTEIKKTLISLLFLLTAFFVANFFFGMAMDKMMLSIPNSPSEIGRMKYSVCVAKNECVILGSSRAHYHYNPEIIGHSLNMDVYNAGRSGHGLTYAFGVLKAMNTRYKPKFVILEINYSELDGSWNDKIISLKPFYKAYPELAEFSDRILGGYNSLKCRINAYRYNSLLLNLVKAFFGGADKTKGFEKLTPLTNAELPSKYVTLPSHFDTVFMDSLLEFCRFCKKSDISVVVVTSPTLVKYNISNPLDDFFKKQDIPYFCYVDDPYFLKHPELFRDESHLIGEGADVYTQRFAQDLKKLDILKKLAPKNSDKTSEK